MIGILGRNVMEAKQHAIRFSPEEWERLSRVYERALDRSAGYCSLTDLIKELMGLLPYRASNPEDRATLMPTHGPHLTLPPTPNRETHPPKRGRPKKAQNDE